MSDCSQAAQQAAGKLGWKKIGTSYVKCATTQYNVIYAQKGLAKCMFFYNGGLQTREFDPIDG